MKGTLSLKSRYRYPQARWPGFLKTIWTWRSSETWVCRMWKYRRAKRETGPILNPDQIRGQHMQNPTTAWMWTRRPRWATSRSGLQGRRKRKNLPNPMLARYPIHPPRPNLTLVRYPIHPPRPNLTLVQYPIHPPRPNLRIPLRRTPEVKTACLGLVEWPTSQEPRPTLTTGLTTAIDVKHGVYIPLSPLQAIMHVSMEVGNVYLFLIALTTNFFWIPIPSFCSPFCLLLSV